MIDRSLGPGSPRKYFGNLMTPSQQVTMVTSNLDITLGSACRFKIYGGKTEFGFGNSSGTGASYEIRCGICTGAG